MRSTGRLRGGPRTRRGLAALFGMLLVAALAVPASAHSVTADGIATEWFDREPSSANLGTIARNAAQQGEYIWRDAAGDMRSDVVADPLADITHVKYTGDSKNLYVLVRLTGTDGIPQIQVAVDADPTTASGQLQLAGFADTTVSPLAQWEYLVQTQFAQRDTTPLVLDQEFKPTGTATADWTVIQPDPAQPPIAVAEIAVPWATLGMNGPPSSKVRLTVASFLEEPPGEASAGETSPIGGTDVSNAIDVVSDCGDPRATGHPNTFLCDVDDGDIDYFADVYFDQDGEPYAPLTITRFLSNASPESPGPATSEWIEVRNMTSAALTLSDYRLGDEETPDASGEAMLVFPSGATLAAGETFVVAADSKLYEEAVGKSPDAEVPHSGSDPAVQDMVPYALWSTSSTLVLTNAGDQILAVDRSNTVVDVVTYGSGAAFAGETPDVAAPTTDLVMTRDESHTDTDDVVADFDPQRFTLTVTKDTAAGGTITSTPAGVNCGLVCTYSFLSGSSVDLSLLPASRYSFEWGGACSGSGACSVKMHTSRSVSAAFLFQNEAPVLSVHFEESADPYELGEGENLSFAVTVSDEDGDSVTVTMTGAPTGDDAATMTPTDLGHSFSWTPGYSRAGQNHNITFMADDGVATSSRTISIAVRNTNRAPSLASPGHKSVREGSPLAFRLAASDPDGETVSYSAVGLPAGATLNATTGAFSWRPTYIQAGSYPVTFTASDGSMSDQETVTLSVTNYRVPTETTLGAVGKAASKLATPGVLQPAHAGRMSVTLFRKRSGTFRAIDTNRPSLGATGRFSTTFDRPAAGTCKVTAVFAGDFDHRPSSAVRTFNC